MLFQEINMRSVCQTMAPLPITFDFLKSVNKNLFMSSRWPQQPLIKNPSLAIVANLLARMILAFCIEVKIEIRLFARFCYELGNKDSSNIYGYLDYFSVQFRKIEKIHSKNKSYIFSKNVFLYIFQEINLSGKNIKRYIIFSRKNFSYILGSKHF